MQQTPDQGKINWNTFSTY